MDVTKTAGALALTNAQSRQDASLALLKRRIITEQAVAIEASSQRPGAGKPAAESGRGRIIDILV